MSKNKKYLFILGFFGLTVTIATWFFFGTINLGSINVKLNGLPATAPTGAAVPPPEIAYGQSWPSDASERADLQSSGNFSFISNPGCTTKGQTDCISLAGSAAIQGLKNLSAACDNCPIQINGGTECWLHDKSTGRCATTHHTQGDYAIDIAHGEAIDSYITSGRTPLCYLPKNGVPRPVYLIKRAVFWDEDSLHWHADFNQSTCKMFTPSPRYR
ncbi:MAG: hypothetical protein A3G09_02000 [Candidatus Moranbacteria bacterium RIFCSPLOWO2_12_FULL_48_12]|nr:MAG: hypothetical protein A3G09_02000 [Candidatus Moranbacteria bacterium RIFCSPLOWO2_12_FULL_48_12]